MYTCTLRASALLKSQNHIVKINSLYLYKSSNLLLF